MMQVQLNDLYARSEVIPTATGACVEYHYDIDITDPSFLTHAILNKTPNKQL